MKKGRNHGQHRRNTRPERISSRRLFKRNSRHTEPSRKHTYDQYKFPSSSRRNARCILSCVAQKSIERGMWEILYKKVFLDRWKRVHLIHWINIEEMLRCGISKATDLLLLYERYNGLSANLNIIIRNFLASLRDKGIFVHLREI